MSNPRIEELFHAALERRGAERAAFLERACAGDTALQAEVESLLAFHERGEALLQSPTAPSTGRSGRRPESSVGSPHLSPVERIGRYPVLGLLGRGSMGVVYLAEDPVLERRIAIKVLDDPVSRDAVRLARFENEARALATLSHPNIATIHSLEVCGATHLITMELVSGRTLADRLCDGPLPLDEALPLCRQVASALEAAHDRGIVDRDLKPANVMVTAEGQVKVLDFGIAKIAPTATRPAVRTEDGGKLEEQPIIARSLTEPGCVIGTPGYMSPEQLRGEDVDHRTDIWALGCILFECLSGRHPFRRASPVEMLAAVLECPPDWVRLPEKTPPAVRALIERCLDRAPDRRPVDMGAVRRVIERELARRAVPEAVLQPASRREPVPTGTADAGVAGLSSHERRVVPDNLPIELDPFIGRTTERETVRRLLGEHRLVTLTGAGGCGKTRLALEVAREARDSDAYRHGVTHVDLAAAVGPAQVTTALATVLGVAEEPRRALIDSLIDRLAGRRLLVVLDNVEGILQATAELATRLLRRHPGLAFLVTSREALAVAGEAIYRVRPLGIPADGNGASASEVGAAESVQLFVERARAANLQFELVDANAAAVGTICRQLDGIPLALELAAARVKALPVEEIARRLDDRFHLLTGGATSGLPHHRTLRALIDWSYQQLTETERLAFERLSVFAGGWTLEGAEAVTVGDGVESWQVLDLCCQLVDKCLAELDTEGTRITGEPRYTMLESIREYARDRLHERPDDAERVHARSVRHCLKLVEAAAPQLRGREAPGWLRRLDVESVNLHAALEACLRSGEVGEGRTAGDQTVADRAVVDRAVVERERTDDGAAGGDADDTETTIDVGLGLRIAGSLGPYWLVRGRWDEGRRVCDALLEHPGSQRRDEARADVLSWAGGLARRQGQDAAARRYYEESLAICRDLAEPRLVAHALSNLALVLQRQGELERAGSLLEESLAVAQELGDQQQIAASLSNLGSHAYRQGDHDRASARFEASLAIQRRLGHRRGIAAALNSLGNVALAAGQLDTARVHYDESLGISRELGDRYLQAVALGRLGQVAKRCGDREGALDLNREALAVHRRLGRRREVATTLLALADLLLEAPDGEAVEPGEVEAMLAEAVELGRDVGHWRVVAEALTGLALLAERYDDPARAARLLGASRATSQGADSPLGAASERRWQQVAVSLRRALGEGAFDRLRNEGQALSRARACELIRRTPG
ncbi:MAG: protein kinase [Candidatus Eiseniibacteriota bacterium]|jgi:non-specific serine/threonine protein kinase